MASRVVVTAVRTEEGEGGNRQVAFSAQGIMCWLHFFEVSQVDILEDMHGRECACKC